MDKGLLQKDYLKNSVQAVGHQYPIKVAVWFEDPDRDSQTSEYRVHMRPFDGRHRYAQDPSWPREYYSCSSVDEFYNYRANLDIRKKDNPEEKKTSFLLYGKYLNEMEKIPFEKIGSTICKRLGGMHKSQILKYLPDEWKDPTKATNRRGKTKPKNEKKMDEKCLEELENLKAEIKRKAEEIKDLENENQRLKMHNDDLFKQLWNFYNPGLKTQNDQ